MPIVALPIREFYPCRVQVRDLLRCCIPGSYQGTGLPCPSETSSRARIYPCHTIPSPTVILSVTERRRREVKSQDPDDAYRDFAASGSSTETSAAPRRPDARQEAAPRKSRRNNHHPE